MTSTVWDWSTTAASNTAVAGISIAEGMDPGNVNNGMRAIMAASKGASWGGISGGTANAQTVTLAPVPTAYAAGMTIAFVVGTTNTGAATLNVNSLGTKAVQLFTAALSGGELTANHVAIVVYDGTQFQLVSGNSDFAQLSLSNTFSHAVTVNGATTLNSTVDINGNDLILDADADTGITADTDDRIDFRTAGTDRVHITSAGRLGVGRNAPARTIEAFGSNAIVAAFNTGQAEVLMGTGDFGYAGTTTAHDMAFRTNNTERLRIENSSGATRPGTDNSVSIGTASHRFTTVYAVNGTINTSDARKKTEVRPMTLAELAAAKELAREVGIFRWLDAVAAKGDAAREHIGVTVQRTIDIMQSHGLDPFRYGFICYDTWDDFQEGGVVTRAAGDLYSFRFDQLLLFIARGQEERLAALEGATR